MLTIESDSGPLNEYESKEPMTPAKIKEHEPTAVKREMTENIAESGQVGTNPQDAAESSKERDDKRNSWRYSNWQ